MAGANPNLWTKLQSLGFAFFAIVVAIGVGTLFVPLLRQRHAMQQELQRLDTEIARQETAERQQKTEIEALKSDPTFIERTARAKLNLVRPGETIFRFEPAPTPPRSTTR